MLNDRKDVISFIQNFLDLNTSNLNPYPVSNLISDNDGNLLLEVAVTGFDPKNIQVYVDNKPDGSYLFIEGSLEKPEVAPNYLHHKLAIKPFKSHFRIPTNMQIIEDSIKIEFGILYVAFEKKNVDSKKFLSIKLGSPQYLAG